MNERKTKSRVSRPEKRDEGGVLPGLALHTRPFRLLTRAILLFAALAILFAVSDGSAQLPIAGNATDFNSVQYYKAPHQQEIQLLFSGAEADPIAGGLLLVKQVKLEKFDLDGKLQLVAEAPECIYDPVNAVANSPGAVHVRNGDGSLTMDGEGFVWRERESLFTISNQVNTVFDKMPALKR
jgi:hypothetical protein